MTPARTAPGSRRITGELLKSCLSVAVGVVSRLQKTERRWTVLQHLATPLHGLFFESLKRHHRIYQAHVQRLLGIVLAAEIPYLA